MTYYRHESQRSNAWAGFSAVLPGLFLMSGCVSNYFFAPATESPNSADSGTSTAPIATTPTVAPSLPPVFQPNGILNGHFDVDTATGALPFPISNGSVTYHVHEYDKINKTTTVDFFNLINQGGTSVAGDHFDPVETSFSSTQRFYLTLVNSTLNPGGVMEINGNAIRVTDYQAMVASQLAAGTKPQVYTIGAPQLAGDIQLKTLKIGFDSNVDAQKLLIPTAPDNCVFPNIPGAKGEYRDGALVVQATNIGDLSVESATSGQANNGGLLWEGIIYNHYMITDGSGNEVDPEYCYSQTFF